VAALIWIGCHIGIAGTGVRTVLAHRLGEAGFRGGFSIISVLALLLLIGTYRNAPLLPLWTMPQWLGWVLVVAMLPAFLLFAASVLTRNPTAIGGEAALQQEPRGILRITRHPMLWSFAIWAAVHALGNGDTASLLFFGAFLLTALAGMPSIDAKVAARDPVSWHRFAAVTSILPFLAIATRRNRYVAAEVNWLAVGLGTTLWAIVLWAHPWIFGVSPLPAG
jgi:uncharacterized membrane protein